MKEFERIPKEIQEVFFEIYHKDIEQENKIAEIDEKIKKLHEEYDSLKKRCTNSYGYTKTRERREDIELDLSDLHSDKLSLLLNKANGADKLYSIMRKVYEEK